MLKIEGRSSSFGSQIQKTKQNQEEIKKLKILEVNDYAEELNVKCDTHRHVNANYVPVLDLPTVRNAMTQHVINRSAYRLREAPVI